MTAYTMDCPPLDSCGACGTLPSGFVRLRYFFGKRMGVADFLDEQRYHAGKMRFHNQRLHGAGLLCGLRVSLDATTDTILRVGKGAAIDSCGREIVVGYDQCIDLDAWYQRELVSRRATDSTWPAAALDEDGRLPLVVAIRFHDCAVGPEPAPRDTCTCNAAGCDFGRVREEFELALMAADDPALAASLPLTPPRAGLDKLLGGAIGSEALAHALADAAAAGCAEADDDGWLVLASFAAVLADDPAGDPHVVDVEELTGKATLLAETALLQELLARQIAASAQAGALVEGPEIAALTLVRDGATDFYWLTLELSAPIMPETLPKAAFTLTQLESTGWTPIPVTTDYVPPTATEMPKIRVRVDNSGDALEKGGAYRLAIDPAKVPLATPIVDKQMRPLRPLQPAIQFGIDQPAADLTLVNAPYAR